MLSYVNSWAARDAAFSKVISAAAIAALVCTTYLLALWSAGYRWASALRDESLFDDDVPFAGSVSNIGIGLMCLSALALIKASAKRRSIAHDALLAFTILFILDDALLIHERFGSFDVVFYAIYGALFATAWALMLQRSGLRPIWPLFFTAGSFAISVLVDVASDISISSAAAKVMSTLPILRHHSLATYPEDMPKFVGIVLFTGFAVSEALRASNQDRIRPKTPE